MSTGLRANYVLEQNSTTWDITVDGKYSKAISKYLLADGIPQEGVTKIVSNAAKALGFCPNPATTEACQKTGIVIGKVQSGKTSNFIALTALAFDNSYDLVVVLGGTKDPLVRQNRDRIKEYFAATKDVLVLDTVDYRNVLTAKNVQQFIKNGKKVIIVALKNPNQINYVKDNIFKNSPLADKPILIIDDEGDEASLNTLVKKGKKSSTYTAIEELKININRHCFVSVTATPQANLLIDTIDILSPDFGILVDPGKGYCGLDVFHSDDTYTVKIDNNESSLIEEGIPKSFVKALSMFFVACAIQKTRGMKPGDKMSMLIHPSHKKIDHRAVFEKVSALIDDWIEYTNNKNDISYEDVQNTLKEAYDDYIKTTVKEAPPFNDIEDDIIQAINLCGKHIVNGDSVPNRADDIYDYNIYIGGAMLGRGLTLKGLTITYIIRTAKGLSNADTVQQRARWFGYKEKYLDLCRVFAVDKIIKEFKAIREHEEDLWDTVRNANLQGTQFKDIARVFVLSDNLRMTRRNVAGTAKYNFSFWNRQRVFQKDNDYITSNTNILNGFKERNVDKIQIEQFGNGAPFSIIRTDFQTAYHEILSKFVIPSSSKFNNPLIDKLFELLTRKNLNPKVDVIWMRDRNGETSKHPIDDDGSIPNYSVGRRPDDPTRPAIYLGDDNQFKQNDVIQIQIHLIEDTKTGIISPTLSMYLPIDVVSHLTNLVIRA